MGSSAFFTVNEIERELAVLLRGGWSNFAALITQTALACEAERICCRPVVTASEPDLI
jgi:hypothetical protein